MIRIIAICLLFVPAAVAEQPIPDSNQSDPGNDAAVERETDIVYLRNGKPVEGRVISQTGAITLVEVHPGVILRLPAGQIERISLVDNRSLDDLNGPSDSSASGGHVERSVRVSPKLGKILGTTFSALSLSDRIDRNIVALLKEIGGRLGIEVNVDDAVHEIPADRLEWAEPFVGDRTVFEFVQVDVAEHFAGILLVDFKDEAIRIRPALAQENER